MNIKKLLGKRIQELRKRRKLTQENLAERINVEPVSISNIENGKYYPSAENLEKIMTVLQISPQKLFTFEHLQPDDNMISEIDNLIRNNPHKLKDIYKIVRALTEE